MKKSALFVLPLLMVVSFSCVSNGKYNELEYQYSRLEEEKQSIENEYSSLVNKYNDLVNKYNSLLNDYETIEYSFDRESSLASERDDIIDRAKDAVYKLKRDFYSFQNGWCDADDIERDIKSVEDKLDGWL